MDTSATDTAVAEPTVDAIVLGALYDFGGFLTTRDKVIPVGSTADAAPMAELVKEFTTKRGLADVEPLLRKPGSDEPAWAAYVGTSPD